MRWSDRPHRNGFRNGKVTPINGQVVDLSQPDALVVLESARMLRFETERSIEEAQKLLEELPVEAADAREGLERYLDGLKDGFDAVKSLHLMAFSKAASANAERLQQGLERLRAKLGVDAKADPEAPAP